MQRRDFIKSVALASSSSVLLGSAYASIGANDRIRAALVGARNMGWANMADFIKINGVECAAICDVDDEVSAKRANEVEKKTGKRPDVYRDYRKVLERKDIDALVIGTPDHWHCLMLCDACAAGKDVYVEKPIANSIAECDAMVGIAKKYKRVVSVGQQQNSSQMWREVIDFIKSDKLGKIGKTDVWANFAYGAGSVAIEDSQPPSSLDYDLWLGPSPKVSFNKRRLHGSWRLFWNYGGGLMTDWGVHLLDMVLQAHDIKSLPDFVSGVGGKFGRPETCSQTFDTMNVAYAYKDKCITWSNTAAQIGPYKRNYGIAFNGQNGTLVANREGWEIIPNGKALEAFSKKPEKDEHLDHVKNFIDCMRSRNFATACTLDNGSLCAKYAHLGNIAARTGLTLKYDDAKKTFNNNIADKYLRPAYRAPWKFPTV